MLAGGKNVGKLPGLCQGTPLQRESNPTNSLSNLAATARVTVGLGPITTQQNIQHHQHWVTVGLQSHPASVPCNTAEMPQVFYASETNYCVKCFTMGLSFLLENTLRLGEAVGYTR